MNDLLVTALIMTGIFIFAMLFGFYATLVLLLIILVGLIWLARDTDAT